MSDHLYHIGKNIATLREYRGMSELELSQKVGISVVDFINLEKGDYNPDINTLVKIAQVLKAYIDINFTPI